MNQPAVIEGGMIYKSMVAVMRDIEFIPKDKKNPQQNYNFRGIDDMYNAVHPLFKKHGIFVLSEVLSEKREERATKAGGVLISSLLDIKFSFVAEDGSRVFSTTKGEAMDSGDKASNKAMSAALKYAVMQTFMIPTKELGEYNTENETHEVAPKAKPQQKPQGNIDEAFDRMDTALTIDALKSVHSWITTQQWTKEESTKISMHIQKRKEILSIVPQEVA